MTHIQIKIDFTQYMITNIVRWRRLSFFYLSKYSKYFISILLDIMSNIRIHIFLKGTTYGNKQLIEHLFKINIHNLKILERSLNKSHVCIIQFGLLAIRCTSSFIGICPFGFQSFVFGNILMLKEQFGISI